MEDINDADYVHAIIVCKDFQIRNFWDSHDIYAQTNTLLTIIYHSAPGLSWQATFKQIKGKLVLLSDTDILLMVEKGIRRGTCHTIHW